jgi:hypothetical protein
LEKFCNWFSKIGTKGGKKMKNAFLILGCLAVVVLAVLVSMVHSWGQGEQALATAQSDLLPTPTKERLPTPHTPAVPKTCILPSWDNPPKITIGREGRDGQLISCALDAFKELFPGCGDPATNPEDFSLELFEAWLASNGYNVETLPDTNGDGIPDPLVHPNQVMIGVWSEG